LVAPHQSRITKIRLKTKDLAGFILPPACKPAAYNVTTVKDRPAAEVR